MRRHATLAIVAGIAVLAVAAVVDALRPDRVAGSRATVATSGPPVVEGRAALAARLDEAGVFGQLAFTDERCRLWRLTLPTLLWRSAEGARAPCRFSLPPQGEPVLEERWQVHPAGGAARCSRGLVEVRAVPPAAEFRYRVEGCAPAWKPDATLTYLRNGALWELTRPCGEGARPVAVDGDEVCGRVALSRRELRRAFHGHPWGRFYAGFISGFGLRDILWLTDTRFVAIAGDPERLLVVFERTRLVRVFPLYGTRLSLLATSPRRTYFAARVEQGREPSIRVFDRNARDVPLPRDLLIHRAIAWSADERSTALATRASIYLFPTGALDGPSIRLPLAARDLAWL